MTEHATESGGGPTLRLDALAAPVEVYRDEWAIPHLRAGDPRDLFVAQGYVHAQDRLWQMDASRRQLTGRWSEWVGSSGLPADRLARRLGGARASRRDYAALGDAAREMVDAYAEGVNCFIDTGVRDSSTEYGLLATEPERWEPWHCIAVMRHRGYLMGSLWFKLWRAAAVGILPDEDVAKLRYDGGDPELLCIPPGVEQQRWTTLLADLRPSLSALAGLRRTDATEGASNNWAVSGSRTATGRPLLAGDPHRAYELPGMYAQMHIACPQFDAIGFTVPGVPAFPHFAHNEHVAWCVTHAFADIHDLFVEQFDPADPTRYLHRDEWSVATTTTELIEVRDAPAERIEIVETRHGPVVAGDPADGSALCLQSVQFADVDRSFDALRRMLEADSCDALFGATRGWGLIDHNLVAADTGGHIGHLVRAIVPRRPASNGWLPVPGWTGEHDWNGTIAWEDMPRVDDPERGYLATANNRVVSSTPGSGDYFCTDAHPPHRARRIESLLADLPAATAADMARIHHDDHSAPALEFATAIGRLQPDDDATREMCRRIAAWDGRMALDSVAAEAYTRLRWIVARLVCERSGLLAVAGDPILADVPPGVSPVSQLWWVLPTLLRDDDTSLLGGAGWDDVLLEAAGEAAGRAPGAWGERHRATFTHPLASSFPGAQSLLAPEGAELGGDNETVWANGCRYETGTAATYGAVGRYVYDVGDWDACTWAVFGGTGGDPAGAHYLDQHDLWSRCEMVPMRYDWLAIATAATSSTTLAPGR